MDTFYLSPTSDSRRRNIKAVEWRKFQMSLSLGVVNVGHLRTLIARDEWRAVFEILISLTPKKDGYTNLAFHKFWEV